MDSDCSEKGASARNHNRAMVWAVGVLVFLCAFTHWRIMGANDLSRFVAVESLAVRGKFHIDDSPFTWRMMEVDGHKVHALVDIVYNRRDAHYYSSKPPVLTMILAGLVAGLNLLGAGLALEGMARPAFIFLQTWLVVGGVTACAFYAYRKQMGRMLGQIDADIVTLLALGGTLFVTYSVTMNHHTITAGLVLLGFFLLGMPEAAPTVSDRRALAAGFLMSLASMIDIGHGFIFSVAFAVYILFYLRSFRVLLLFVLGAIAPLAVHCAVQYRIWGSVLPVQMIKGAKDYPHSYWQHPRGMDALRIARSRYWLLTLLSMRGLFVLSPILLVGMAALVREIIAAGRPPKPSEGQRKPWWTLRGTEAGPACVALTVLFGILFLVFYYSFRAGTNFGGACYGFRWYIGFTPLLAFYAARGYAFWHEKRLFRRAFIILGLVSVMYALIGLPHPWIQMEGYPHPAVQLLIILRGF